MKTRLFILQYERDNSINLFGDYDRIVCIVTKSESGEVSKKWLLISFIGAPTRDLNDSEIRDILENMFFRQAEIKDK